MSIWDAKAAEWYADKYGAYGTNRLGIEGLTFPPGSLVVDIGCGTGFALRLVAAQAPTAALIGVDPVPRMLEIAEDRTSGDLQRRRQRGCDHRVPRGHAPIHYGPAGAVLLR